MRSPDRPLAITAMDRFGVPEALAGDLLEERRRGRTALWLWRQAVGAIVEAVVRTWRQHPLRTVRAAAVRWLTVVVWVESTLAAYVWVSEKWVYAWANQSIVLFELWIPFGGGLCLIWCVGSALSGWVSARQSGSYRAAMVVASALVQVPYSLWWTRHFWLYGEFTTRVSARLWVPNYLWAGVVLVGMPLSTLIGGLNGLDPAGNARREC
jgi:hypothetical protein